MKTRTCLKICFNLINSVAFSHFSRGKKTLRGGEKKSIKKRAFIAMKEI